MDNLENHETNIPEPESAPPESRRRRRAQHDPRSALAVPELIQPGQSVPEPAGEPVQPVPDAEPVQPVPAVEPARPVPAAEPVQPVPAVEPAQPVSAAKPAQPVPAAKPVPPEQAAEERPAPAAPPVFVPKYSSAAASDSPAPPAFIPAAPPVPETPAHGNMTWEPEKGWVPAPRGYNPADAPSPDDYRSEPQRPSRPLFNQAQQQPYAPRFTPAASRPQAAPPPERRHPHPLIAAIQEDARRSAPAGSRPDRPRNNFPKQKPEKQKTGRAGKIILITLICLGVLCASAGVLMYFGVLPDYLNLRGSGGAPEATAAPDSSAAPFVTAAPDTELFPEYEDATSDNSEPAGVFPAAPTAGTASESVQPRIVDGKLYGRAVQPLLTRSGPGASYPETGTYQAAEQYIHIISRAYDEQADLWWVKCEIPFQGETRTFWTAYTRFDAASLPLDLIPVE